MVREVAAADADGVDLGDVFGRGHQRWHRPEGFAGVVHVQPCDDDPHAAVGQFAADLDDAVVEELRFVDAHDVDLRGHQQDVARRVDRRGADGVGVVRNDLLLRVAHVDAGFEYLDFLVCVPGAFEAAYQLLGLTREHRAADHFDPALAAGIFQKHKFPIVFLNLVSVLFPAAALPFALPSYSQSSMRVIRAPRAFRRPSMSL